MATAATQRSAREDKITLLRVGAEVGVGVGLLAHSAALAAAAVAGKNLSLLNFAIEGGRASGRAGEWLAAKRQSMICRTLAKAGRLVFGR